MQKDLDGEARARRLLLGIVISLGLLGGVALFMRNSSLNVIGKAGRSYEIPAAEIPEYVANAFFALEDGAVKYLSSPASPYSQDQANVAARGQLRDQRIWEACVDNGEQQGFTPIRRLGDYNIRGADVVSLKMEENAKFVGRTLKFDVKTLGAPTPKIYAYFRFIRIQGKVCMIEVCAEN